MTPKELVLSTLEFRNKEGRVPRQLWTLPWAESHYPEMVEKLNEDFHWDIVSAPACFSQQPITHGEPYEIGEYVDEWGCKFTNILKGVIGESKHPLVNDDDWEDACNIHIPEEILSFDADRVNAFCAEHKDDFVMAGYTPRPFERLQFIRGTANLYMDLMDMPDGLTNFTQKMHDFYCRVLTKWAETDVDALSFMDDWGSQRDLLINPDIWKAVFKPMYRDFIEIAHSHGKKIFMHSDGNILRILSELVDIELDAVNAQIFCIGLDNLKPFQGKITFWGEIDRQNLIPHATQEEIDAAVQSVYDTLWCDGGCIAQCEFGNGANPDNIHRIFEKWNSLR